MICGTVKYEVSIQRATTEERYKIVNILGVSYFKILIEIARRKSWSNLEAGGVIHLELYRATSSCEMGESEKSAISECLSLFHAWVWVGSSLMENMDGCYASNKDIIETILYSPWYIIERIKIPTLLEK